MLRHFNGRGAVRLIEADADAGIFLMERLKPGAVLTEIASEARDDEATRAAAGVMRALWTPAPAADGSLPTVQDWAAGLAHCRAYFAGSAGPFPVALFEEAESLSAALLGSMSEPVLLHGDLHHDNIVSAEREPWLAIDPKGLIGEPAYEVGALLRNLWTDRHEISDPRRLLQRRVDILSDELGIDRGRIRGWAVAQAVLSAWWGIEDGDDGWATVAIPIAQMLAEVRA